MKTIPTFEEMHSKYKFSKVDTNEIHIFKSNYKCTDNNQKSLCNRDFEVMLGECFDVKGVRIRAAELGREVCGTCVSKLYKTK